jgi:glycosyltransferase involved in cell wall biosynthesis
MAGYDISLVAQHDKEEVVDSVRVVPLPRPKNRFDRMTRIAWITYQKARKIDADIYHFHDPELIPIGLLLRRQRKNVIYDVHEDYFEAISSKHYLFFWIRKLFSWGFDKFEKFAAKKFSGVIPATPTIEKRFERINKNTVIIQNFAILDEFHTGETLPWAERSNSVVYVGGIAVLRGAREMVEAIRIASEKTNIRLIIAGNFSPRSLKDEIATMKGWEQTEYLGYLSRERLSNILGRAKAGLVLTHPEPRVQVSYPVKLFEYMSAGIPVIASDFPLWKEIVEGANSGMCVDPLNPEEIARAIRWIIEHPTEAQTMGKNGRQAVLDKYNWETESQKLLMIYEKLFRQ